ncbi:hypothetical protein EJ06DRAFT_386872 [Trichodelitschia bisporula]|uniref:Uncharacterized protein n=1 Tax=Trichodelitschia bisporula TaxID=703511 RepID=A0A6G1HZ45_9PEZI|nr:hypothetical protein EJ06DRAFT_386872 [Trichodelitschia bisporula]
MSASRLTFKRTYCWYHTLVPVRSVCPTSHHRQASHGVERSPNAEVGPEANQNMPLRSTRNFHDLTSDIQARDGPSYRWSPKGIRDCSRSRHFSWFSAPFSPFGLCQNAESAELADRFRDPGDLHGMLRRETLTTDPYSGELDRNGRRCAQLRWDF